MSYEEEDSGYIWVAHILHTNKCNFMSWIGQNRIDELEIEIYGHWTGFVHDVQDWATNFTSTSRNAYSQSLLPRHEMRTIPDSQV